MSIVRKIINGTPYLYEQYKVHGRTYSRYIGPEEEIRSNPETYQVIIARRELGEERGSATKLQRQPF